MMHGTRLFLGSRQVALLCYSAPHHVHSGSWTEDCRDARRREISRIEGKDFMGTIAKEVACIQPATIVLTGDRWVASGIKGTHGAGSQ